MKDGFAKFTGDTGHTLDWQIGFEDPIYENTFNFLPIVAGIGAGAAVIFGGKKKEQKKRAEGLANQRKTYPAPTSCAMATSNLAKLRIHLADAKKRYDAGKGGVEREIEALTTILNEHTNYINTNCLAAIAPAPVQTKPVVTTPAAVIATAKQEATSAVSLQSITDTVKKVPTWVWWTAGGALVLITTIVIIKK